MTFYLTYRPQKLEELDIADVRESLQKIVSSGKIPHAFLFAGPKGTGKTSAARILAKILNCEKEGKEPCNKCEQCVSITKGSNIDVIELDAASHRGIDDVRAIKDAVKLAPARARKKVYIIDEAHMLTTEASNALLKTLEEPPSHVVIILATTNPEKLIDTIRSRAVIISFRKATPEEIATSLGRIVKGEKSKMDKESLLAVAKAAEGSFRDGAKILETLFTEKKKLDKDSIEEFLFNKKAFNIENFIDLLSQKDTKGALGEISGITQRGGSMDGLLTALLQNFREGLLAKVGIGKDSLSAFSKGELIYLIELFAKAQSDLKSSTIEELPIEIAVIRWGEKNSGSLVPKNPKEDLETQGTNAEPKEDLTNTPAFQTVSKPLVMPFVKKGKEISEDTWKKILELTRPVNASIEALLRAARPLGFDGKTLTLAVFYRFHKERLEDGHHRRVLEEIVATVLGTPARILCVLTDPPPKAVTPEVKKEDPILTEGEDKDIIKAAEEIFGN